MVLETLSRREPKLFYWEAFLPAVVMLIAPALLQFKNPRFMSYEISSEEGFPPTVDP